MNKIIMTTEFLYNFISRYKYAVLSTVTENCLPESALVGFAITRDLKIIFDTVTTSRKYQNLIKNPSIAFVIGWDDEKTVQYEGKAKGLTTDEHEALLQIYLQVFPDGKDRKENWKDITYFCVEPNWIRYADFNFPVKIDELKL